MSIIMGPYEKEARLQAECEDDELLVFGYACKLFRDDTKGLLEDSGQLLIPWMGDSSLMVDRYDIRNRLEDKSQFGLKPNLPRRMTKGEEELEEVLDHERYLALGVDILEHELREEEAEKRAHEGGDGFFRAVGFNYDAQPPVEEATHIPAHLPELPEHPPTSAVDVVGREAPFIMPDNLDVPGHVKLPATNKLHSIVERTALFVAKQGTQMEIMIKAKQKFNPFFSFLSLYDPLHPYYRHLLQLITSGKYTPNPEAAKTEEEEGSGEVGGGGEDIAGSSTETDTARRGEEEAMPSDNDGEPGSDDSDGEEFELHPLLRVSTNSSPRLPSHQQPPRTTATPSTAATTTLSLDQRHNTSFYAKSLSVNAAPSLEREREDGVAGRDYSSSQSAYHYSHSPYTSHHMGGPEEQAYHYHHPPHYLYCDGYDYHPTQSDYSSQYSLEAYYHRLSAQHISRMEGHSTAPSPAPPPPDLQPIIDKTAEYVARNSEQFERTVLERHCGDPKFGFLNPWNKYYAYYKLRLQQFKERAVLEEGQRTAGGQEEGRGQGTEEPQEKLRGKKVQKLSQSGTVSFRLEPKVVKVLETPVDLSTKDEEEEEEKAEEKEEGEKRVEDGPSADYQQDDLDQPYAIEAEQYSYSAEGVYYHSDAPGDGEDPPAPKRARMAPSSKGLVMDNKVKEFLDEVKAVLDS